MTRRTALVLAVVSLTVALVLGAVDSETHDLGDLLAGQYLPALALFAVVASPALSGCRLGMTVLVRRPATGHSRQERSRSSRPRPLTRRRRSQCAAP